MLVLDYDGLASCPGGSRNTPSRFMLQKPGINGPLGSKGFIFFLDWGMNVNKMVKFTPVYRRSFLSCVDFL